MKVDFSMQGPYLIVIPLIFLAQGVLVISIAELLCRSAGKPSLLPVLWIWIRGSAPYALLLAALLCLPPAWSFVVAALAWIMGRTTA